MYWPMRCGLGGDGPKLHRAVGKKALSRVRDLLRLVEPEGLHEMGKRLPGNVDQRNHGIRRPWPKPGDQVAAPARLPKNVSWSSLRPDGETCPRRRGTTVLEVA
jgi:hypothetical protein